MFPPPVFDNGGGASSNMFMTNAQLEEWEARFDGVHPRIWGHLNVSYKGNNITALLFDTDRAPYVVKTGQSGETRRMRFPGERPVEPDQRGAKIYCGFLFRKQGSRPSKSLRRN